MLGYNRHKIEAKLDRMLRPYCYSRFVRFILIGIGALVGVSFWLLNVSRPGRPLHGCTEGCTVRTSGRLATLRVLSLNVLHAFPRFERLPERMEIIQNGIRHYDADVVCLQEVPWTLQTGNVAQRIAERVAFNYVYLRANGNRWAILFEEGVAILSHYPLSDVRFVELRPRAGFFEHRVALQATVVTPVDDVVVVCTHLTNKSESTRIAQVLALRQFVESEKNRPAVVAGDFNMTEEVLTPLLKGWQDAYRVIHPSDTGLTCCIDDLSAPPDEQMEKRIDYIFLAPPLPSWKIVDSHLAFEKPVHLENGEWLWASDHVGLLIEIAPQR